MEKINLTQFSRGSGCGCKIDPALLEKILSGGVSRGNFDALIGGYETKDDSAVWQLDGGKYLLSTTDFFTPVVDDAFDFGRIAAANALSDIYSMGGRPAFALAILGFPVEKLPYEIAKTIMDGARNVCNLANIPIAGGHSIDAAEPVFGLAVNGFVEKEFLKKNSGAVAGDKIYLTKPLGTGIVAAALKRGKADSADLKNAVEVMCHLNSAGIKLALNKNVHAMTDVTGFGFLGHLIEVCEASGVSARINFPSLPVLRGLDKYTDQFIMPDNTYRNWNAFSEKVSGVNGPEFITLCDPQTSGGLLFSASPGSEEEVRELLTSLDLGDFIKPVGEMTGRKEKVVEIIPG